MIRIREEQIDDIQPVHELNTLAFETEADLVDVLRENTQPVISLVAVDADTLVGHIMFTPVKLSGNPSLNIMGLAPMAVMPDRQRCGIGSALAGEGLDRCSRGSRRTILDKLAAGFGAPSAPIDGEARNPQCAPTPFSFSRLSTGWPPGLDGHRA